jgi:3'(2'), 5'-bisphosphate nucleotidase
MMEDSARNALAHAFGDIASAAGKVIMDLRRAGVRITRKPDGSPVSAADTEAEALIRARLSAVVPDTPIIAEESADLSLAESVGNRFLLVDPLDGTREFAAGRDDFTVNIALIEDGAPVAGCVYAPARQRLYIAGARTWRCELEPGARVPATQTMQILAVAPSPTAGLRAVVSRSHLDAESAAVLDRLKVSARQPIGSSIKFCLIAQGDADVYPRLGPTMEWDTAAGQAILTAAGGRVVGRDGQPLRYGKPGFRNDGFIAWGGTPRP